MKIYLDTNILKLSIDDVTRMFPRKRTLHLGNGNTVIFDQYDIRQVNPNDKIMDINFKKEVDLLPTLAAYGEVASVEFMINIEVVSEFYCLPGSMESKGFHHAPITYTDPPLKYQRCLFGPAGEPPDQMMVKFLEKIKHKRFLQLQRACGAYQGGNRLNSNQLIDAYHIWCAEVAGADYFLTCDLKLLRQVTDHRTFPPKVKVVKPSELLEIIMREQVVGADH